MMHISKQTRCSSMVVLWTTPTCLSHGRRTRINAINPVCPLSFRATTTLYMHHTTSPLFSGYYSNSMIPLFAVYDYTLNPLCLPPVSIDRAGPA